MKYIKQKIRDNYSIKQRLFIYFMSTILLVILFFTVFNIADNIIFYKNSLNVTIQNISNFSKWNTKHTIDQLGILAEKFIEHIVKDIADDISTQLKNGTFHNDLSLDDNLKSYLYKQDIYNGMKTGSVLLIKGNKIILNTVEGDTFSDLNEFKEATGIDIDNDIKKLNYNHPESFYYEYQIKDSNKEYHCFISAQKILNTDLIIAYIVYPNEYLKSINDKINLERNKEEARTIGSFLGLLKSQIIFIILSSLMLIFIISLIAVSYVRRLTDKIATPIIDLTNQIKIVNNEKFDLKIHSNEFAELKELAFAFNKMGSRLQDNIKKLQEEIISRQKYESEIQIAKSIQESMLPKFIPEEVTSNNCSLKAVLHSSEVVAGDFYDYFISGNKLFICIADVSGKGISAAFFMTLTINLIRNLCGKYEEPNSIFEKANNIICGNNPEDMFTTAILAIYDFASKSLNYSIAGHDPMIKISGNSLIETQTQNNPPLGVKPFIKYKSFSMNLEEGDVLFFYTDGLTDAKSKNGNRFKKEKLFRFLRKHSELNVQELSGKLSKTLHKYQNHNLCDDMTFIIFKIHNN